ncbi:hypothetical protein Tco_0993672 [Tanacetum coccineum]
MGTFWETLAEGTEGAPHLGPEQLQVYSDLSPEDKERYNVDIRATNILLQGLPKDIYSLINHYTDAKGIWDNVKMLLEGSELTKEDRESQLYDDFEHFRQNKGETIHDYYVRFAKLINGMRNIKMTMSRMQLNSKFVNNMLPEWGRFVTVVKLNKGLRDSNYDQLYAYLKQHEAHANENKMMLDRFTQHTVDPLALMSNVSHQQHYSQSSTYVPPHFVDNTQLDLGISSTYNLIENLTNTLALLTQSYKTYLPQTNNQLRTSSNTRNQTTFQDGKNSEYFKDKMLLMQAHENGVALDEEQLLFLAGGQDNAIDEDVDEQPVHDLALNVDNVFQADDYLVYDEAGPSYDSDILSEVHDHDHYQDSVCEHHEEHEMHDDIQPTYVVDSHADYTSDSNMIPYDQYVKDNAVSVVQSDVSSVPNNAYMMIFKDMHEPHAQSVSDTTRNTVVDNSLTAELATYKEQVELYERRARFELTEREQKIDEQLRIVITDRNIKEENLKKELHSIKMQLASTINHNKSMVEEVTSLKKDFKQKENKYLEEFLDMKALKEKVEDKLYKQDQSLQTVHMLCKPKPYYNEQNKVAIGYKNPLCLTRAKQVQPALYNGYEIIKNNHVPALVHNTEDTLEIAEITRRKMNDKMKDPECVTHKVKIAPPDYSKENYLATFTPQKQLTPEQIFWSQDLIKMKEEALKKQTTASRPIKALTVYPPNTPATLVPRVLPTKSQVKINIFALIQLFSEFEKTCKKRITPTGLTEGERGFEQTKECYLTEDNAVPVVQSNVSSVPNDAYMMIFNDMHEPHAQFVSDTTRNTVVDNLLTAKLATYKDKLLNVESSGQGSNLLHLLADHKHRSNTRKNRISPALKVFVYKKKVEEHPRSYRSSSGIWTQAVQKLDWGSLVWKPKQVRQLTEHMAPVQLSTGPAPTFLTLGQISLGHVPNLVPAAPYVPPTNKDLEILFQPMFDEYMEPPRVERPVSPAPAVSVSVNSAGTPSSTIIDQDVPSPSHSMSSSVLQSPSLHQGVAADSTLMEDNPFAPVDNHPFINVFAPEPSSEASSSGDLSLAESPYVSQTLHHLRK